MQQHDPLSGYVSSGRAKLVHSVLEDVRVTYVSAMYWRNRRPWRLGWRTVRDDFFLFPMRGRILVGLADGERLIKPGQFLMLPFGVRHRLELPRPFRRVEHAAVHVHLQDRWGARLLTRFAQPVGRLQRERREGWFETLRQLVSVGNADAQAAQPLSELLIKQLLVEQIHNGRPLAPQSAPPDSRIATAVHRMQEEPLADVTVSRLAADCALSEVQFRKLFLRQMGRAPHAYLAELRLQRATALLRQTARRVKEVAREAGFRNEHYFHLVFKAKYGLTPSEYRQQHAHAL